MKKICKICNQEKDINEFEKGRCQCRKCRNEYKRIYCKGYYQKNKEYIKDKVNEYRLNNLDKIKHSRHLNYIKNKEHILNKNKEYMNKHPEKRRLYFENRYYKNRKEILKRGEEYNKNWKKENKDKVNVVKRISRYIIKHGIKLPKKCSVCGVEGCEVERHHPDYNKRNEIVILCNSCHSKANRGKEGFKLKDLEQYIIDVTNPI